MADAETNTQLLMGEMGKDRWFAAVMDNLPATILALVAAPQAVAYGNAAAWTAGAAAYFGYYFVSEVLFRNTLGKLFMGLCIRQTSGARCTRAQLSIRSLFRILEVNPILLGALPAALSIVFSKRKQRIGDLVAGTIVVRRSELT
jgi:uncharacterized RDD family membrane protein YckC